MAAEWKKILEAKSRVDSEVMRIEEARRMVRERIAANLQRHLDEDGEVAKQILKLGGNRYYLFGLKPSQDTDRFYPIYFSQFGLGITSRLHQRADFSVESRNQFKAEILNFCPVDAQVAVDVAIIHNGAEPERVIPEFWEFIDSVAQSIDQKTKETANEYGLDLDQLLAPPSPPVLTRSTRGRPRSRHTRAN